MGGEEGGLDALTPCIGHGSGAEYRHAHPDMQRVGGVEGGTSIFCACIGHEGRSTVHCRARPLKPPCPTYTHAHAQPDSHTTNPRCMPHHSMGHRSAPRQLHGVVTGCQHGVSFKLPLSPISTPHPPPFHRQAPRTLPSHASPRAPLQGPCLQVSVNVHEERPAHATVASAASAAEADAVVAHAVFSQNWPGLQHTLLLRRP